MACSERAFSDWLWENELKPMQQRGEAMWFKMTAISVRGRPDWIGCVNGYFISLELKKENAKKDKGRERLQAYTAERLKEAGCILALTRVTKSSWLEKDRATLMSILNF